MNVRVLPAAIAGALALTLAAALAPRQLGHPNILLITVDTLRADRLGIYGDAAARTPHMDRLGREGIVFDNAACPMPLTRPSHASILVSRYPRDHGVMNNRIALDADAVTLPSILQREGYRTAGFMSAKLLGPDSGLGQGMTTFVAPRSVSMWDADVTIPKVERWLEQTTASRAPFFIWLHLFDPHLPYAPPARYRPVDPLSTEMPEASWEGLARIAERNGGALSREVLERAERLYEGEIAFTDRWIGELLDRLEDLGLLDATVIVLTADHGECFENGIYFEHSECLFDGGVKVPLMFRYPARIAPGRRADQVENIDIAPTILQLADLPISSDFKGRSLLEAGAADGGYAFLQHPLYQQETADNRRKMLSRIRSVAGVPVRPLVTAEDQVGVRTPAWKYLLLGRSPELYDLAADPNETKDVAASAPASARALDARLQEWVRNNPLRIVDDSKINDELRETLRSLGYIQ